MMHRTNEDELRLRNIEIEKLKKFTFKVRQENRNKQKNLPQHMTSSFSGFINNVLSKKPEVIASFCEFLQAHYDYLGEKSNEDSSGDKDDYSVNYLDSRDTRISASNEFKKKIKKDEKLSIDFNELSHYANESSYQDNIDVMTFGLDTYFNHELSHTHKNNRVIETTNEFELEDITYDMSNEKDRIANDLKLALKLQWQEINLFYRGSKNAEPVPNLNNKNERKHLEEKIQGILQDHFKLKK